MGSGLAVIGAGGPGGTRPLGELLGAAGGDRRHPDARQVHVPVRLRPPDPRAGQLARAGPVPSLGLAGGGRAGGGRASSGWAGPGEVRLRSAAILALVLVAASIPILLYVYAPVWTHPRRWTQPYHLARYRWLGREFIGAAVRDAILLVLGFALMPGGRPGRASPRRRRGSPGRFPVLVLVDLLAAHARTCRRSLPTTGRRRRRRRWPQGRPGIHPGLRDRRQVGRASRATPPSRSISWPRATRWTGACPPPGACRRPRARRR